MARHLQLPNDLNPDQPRALVPQWMTDHHDSSNNGPNLTSALVEKGSLKRASDDASVREKGTWRSEDRQGDKVWGTEKQAGKTWLGEKHTEKVWGAADQFHHPQPERPTPPGTRGPRRDPEFSGPGKGTDRWREDGQARWGHSGNHHEPGTLPSWGSPSKGIAHDSLGTGDTWGRLNQGHSNYQRSAPGQVSHRADTGRWGTNAGKWGPEDHHTPSRPSPWETSKQTHEHSSKDAPRNGVQRGFSQYGRGKPIGRESGAASDRWTPSVLAHHGHVPHEDGNPTDVLPAKLGHGPQKHKYTIEQLLTVYADLSESGRFHHDYPKLPDGLGDLPAPETEASLLHILNAIAQSIVEDGFATKAERRLASRLNSLLEAAERDKYGDSDAQTGDHDLVSPGSAIGSGLSVGTQDGQQHRLPDRLFEQQQSPFSSTQPHLDQQKRTVGDPAARPPAPAAQAPDRPHQPVGIPPGGLSYHGPSSAGQPQDGRELEDLIGGNLTQGPGRGSTDGTGREAVKEEEWYYKDPKGEIHGPYPQEAIETWHESGFFPQDLPLSTSKTAAQWRPLHQQLAIWREPQKQPHAPDLLPADSFLSHQTSGQVPHFAAQSAASRMLEAAETGGMYSQSSSGFPPQQYGQAPRQSQQAYNQQSLLSNPASHSSFPMDRPPNAHPYLPQQMSHPLGNQISGQLGNPMSHQLSQSGSKSFNQPSDLSLYLLSQQISQGLPQYAQIGSQPGNQNIPGLSALDEQLKTLNLQNNRPYDAPQPYQDLHSARGQRDGANDLLSRLQGRPRQHLAAPQPAPNQADPIVDLLGSLTRDSHHAPTSLAPIGPQSHHSSQQYPPAQQQPSSELSSGFQLDEWMRSQAGGAHDQRQPSLGNVQPDVGSFDKELLGSSQQLPYSALPETSRLLDPARAVSKPQEIQPPEHRPVADQIVQPKPKPAIAAVGPPKKQQQLSAPPPATLMNQPSREEPRLSEDSQGSFQKVQRPRKRESNQGDVQIQPPPPPPAAKAPTRKPAADQKVAQDSYDGPTLGEAAGLLPSQDSSEPHVAPWAGQVAKGGQQRTLLDIQKEEAEQARIRQEQEAAAAAAAAAAAPTPVRSSWAKPLTKPAPPAMLSFAEIQEQEKRHRGGSVQPPPPPPPAAAQPQWGSSTGREGKTLANRLSQSIQENEPVRKVKHSPPAKAPSKPQQQDDDELFWDPKAGNSDGGHRNGNANDPDRALALALEESQREQHVSEAESSLSPEFAAWCRSKLKEFGKAADDLNLILFLMTVGSNTDVADYMTQFFGKTSAVAAFSNEFIKRKLVEQNAGKRKGKKQKPMPAATAASSNSGIGVAPINSGGATGWSKLPKKKKKGQKIDSTMLGFGTGTNYAALEKLEG